MGAVRPNSGGFKKGDDPRRNPGGRHKSVSKVKAKAVEAGEEMITILIEIARDKKGDKRNRVMAAREVLDRGVGRPTQAIAGDPDMPGISIGPDEKLIKLFTRLAGADKK